VLLHNALPYLGKSVLHVAARTLKPKGLISIVTVDFTSFTPPHDKLAQRQNHNGNMTDGDQHHNFSHCLKDYNFKVLDLKTFDLCLNFPSFSCLQKWGMDSGFLVSNLLELSEIDQLMIETDKHFFPTEFIIQTTVTLASKM
jgi:hypothetical protein